MVDMAALKAMNAERWAAATPTKNFSYVAKALVAAKNVYLEVQQVTKVPWWVIAVVHERESSQNWNASLAQGDPWNRVSIHVPVGRGPFNSWKEAAIDALVYCSPHAASNTDWSIGGTLTLLEEYNGLGYASKLLPSPYLWSGTSMYVKGKYIRDHVFDPEEVDVQMGCAGLLMAMRQWDTSINVGSIAIPYVPAPTVVVPPKPVAELPKDSVGSWVKSWFT